MKTLYIFAISLLFSFSSHSANDVFGVQFNCKNDTEKNALMAEMGMLTSAYEVEMSDIEYKTDKRGMGFNLRERKRTETTLSLSNKFKLKNEEIFHPALGKSIPLVSKKEIFLSLLSPGRITEFKSCKIEALQEHIEIRQNTVLWASQLDWGWPDGDYAFWNREYWTDGTPKEKAKLYESMWDVFTNQSKYGIGCYTAAKLVYAFAALDYYKRLNPQASKEKAIEDALWSDNDPLINIEPTDTWSFEDDFVSTPSHEGKVLNVLKGVSASSLVPGDWIYFLNTDAKTKTKIGYEGSNTIYLGNGRFSDYYNDNEHSYSLDEKLDEVYQWRNGVFSRSRDAHKIEVLSEEQKIQLLNSPEDGGLLMTWRGVYKSF